MFLGNGDGVPFHFLMSCTNIEKNMRFKGLVSYILFNKYGLNVWVNTGLRLTRTLQLYLTLKRLRDF